jgi:prevent-host-death family protein
MRVGLREANQRFSQLVKAVRRGKEVILTDRGRPVARLTAITDVPDGDEEAVLRRLEESGFLKLPSEPGLMPPYRGHRIRGKSIVSTIREERDED